MDAADAFDVIHVLYERDILPVWEQDTEIKDGVRKQLYETMYETKYKFASPKSSSASDMTYGLGPDQDLDSIPDLSEVPVESKGYIEPTAPEDLPFLLDPPLN